MEDIYAKVEVFPDHFQEIKESDDIDRSRKVTDYSLRSHSRSWAIRRVIDSASVFNLFRLARLPWASSSNDNDRVVLSVAEIESLRSEIADAEEKEAHLNAQLEHIEELLKVARLSGYLYRWSELPGEPPILDDEDVDDWLPRFVVLHGQCIFFYLKCTDLSPMDTTMLVDIVDVGPLPSFLQEDGQRRYALYILTTHGLKFECSNLSEIQVDSWLVALQCDCKLQPRKSSLDL